MEIIVGNSDATVGFCSQCGASVAPDGKYCSACGTAILSLRPAPNQSKHRAAVLHNATPATEIAVSNEVSPLSLWRHPAVYFVAYMLALIPTYILPYLGSNSVLANTVSAAIDDDFSTAFWLHCTAFYLLLVITWFRGSSIGRNWLPALPAIAALFDLMPGLNWVPLAPTLFHIIALIAGVTKESNRGIARKFNKVVASVCGLLFLLAVTLYDPIEASGEGAQEVAERHENNSLIGVWGPKGSGCATDYSVGYAPDGRFSEGDVEGGIEGRWFVNQNELVRETELRYAPNESDSFSEHQAQKMHRTDSFPIVRLTSDELVIQDGDKQFSYVRCRNAKIHFFNGEII